MNLKKILVVGGSGFVGINLINFLLKTRRYAIYSVSRSRDIDGVKNIKVDLFNSNFDFVNKVNPDYVVYLGTISSPQKSDDNKILAFKSNVLVVNRFLNMVKRNGIKKIVFLSSYLLYKDTKKTKYVETDTLDPFRSAYNFSKYIQEMLINLYRRIYLLPITVFRMSNAYGPYQEVANSNLLVESLFRKAIVDKRTYANNMSVIRDWVFIDDIAKSICLELETRSFGTFNLGTGVGISVRLLVKTISKLTAAKVCKAYNSKDVKTKLVCDTKKLYEHLNYIPDTKVDVGLKKTYNYYRKLYNKT